MGHILFISALLLVTFLPEVCGNSPLNPLIVGGTTASRTEWPWQVYLGFPGSAFCGGSLINHQWILTAAHCFDGEVVTNTVVLLGIVKRSGDQNEVRRSVIQWKIHEVYNSEALTHDIALLKMNLPVTFDKYIMPIPLAQKGSTFYTGIMAWVAGWGRLSEGGSTSDVLMHVKVPIVGANECKCLNRNMAVEIPVKTICAGYREGGKDACKYDSGGPLMVKGKVWVQAGIVSFGKGCARPNQPAVYTEVSEFQDWINGVVGTVDPPEFRPYYTRGEDKDKNYICGAAAGTAASTFTAILCLCLITFNLW